MTAIIITQYQRRWRVEEYHRSLKNNASLQASPAKTDRTQSNHIFASVHAFFTLELMKVIPQDESLCNENGTGYCGF